MNKIFLRANFILLKCTVSIGFIIYDCEPEAQPLALFSYCLQPNPMLMTQSDFASKSLPISIPFYRIEKTSTNSNYIIFKVGANYTQCVHKLRLKRKTPLSRVDDVTVINFKISQIGSSLGYFCGEPTLFDESIPSLLEPPTTEVATRTVREHSTPVIKFYIVISGFNCLNLRIFSYGE